jgi:hypothetical protein
MNLTLFYLVFFGAYLNSSFMFFLLFFFLTKHILIKIGYRFKFIQVKLVNNQSHNIPSERLWDATWLN